MSLKRTFTDLTGLYRHAREWGPRLHEQLSYREFDEQHQLFINTDTLGFGLNLHALPGANDELIHTLNRLVTDLPEGPQWQFQCILIGHHQIRHQIEANAVAHSQRGGMAGQVADHQARYARHGARHGFFSHRHQEYHDLNHYQARCFVTTQASNTAKEALLKVRRSLMSSFAQCHLQPGIMDVTALIDHVMQTLNHDRYQEAPITRDYNPLEPLHTQMLAMDSRFAMIDEAIECRFTPPDHHCSTTTRLVHLGLTQLPHEMRLYSLPNVLASLEDPTKRLRCPFHISVHWSIEPTGRQATRNESKIRSLRKWLASPMAVFMPTGEQELNERKALQQQLLNEQTKVTQMLFTVTLFTDPERIEEQVASSIAAFRQVGLNVHPTKGLQAQALLASLPFQCLGPLMRDCQRSRRVRTIKSTNLVNFLPIVADAQSANEGMLLPTMRHQWFVFDPFHCGSDNHNIALTGTSGSGKSFFTQMMALSIYARGGKIWILDKGDSYKKLTLALGGVYMNASQITLNPFTHLNQLAKATVQAPASTQAPTHSNAKDTCDAHNTDPLADSLSDIGGLLAAMAAPNTDLDDYCQAMLDQAIINAWQAHGNQTVIDDVQAALIALADERDDRRLHDLAAQLDKYCQNGLYGDVFNKPSQLDPSVDFTTLELDGFSDAVRTPVVFALMAAINQQMFLAGNRKQPKLCIIEEAWSLMAGSNRQGRAFINQGYRTARKFGGGFATITQGIEDFTASEEAKAALNNSDIHITLRQGKGFADFLAQHPDHFTPFETAMIKRFPTAQSAGYACVMIKAGQRTTFHRVFADPWTRMLLSSHAHEFAYCEQLLQQGLPLTEAVEQAAWHFCPDEMSALETTNGHAQTLDEHTAHQPSASNELIQTTAETIERSSL